MSLAKTLEIFHVLNDTASYYSPHHHLRYVSLPFSIFISFKVGSQGISKLILLSRKIRREIFAPNDYPRFMFTNVYRYMYTSQWRESKPEFTLQHLSVSGIFNSAVCSSNFTFLMMNYRIMICKWYRKKQSFPNCKCYCDNCLDWLKKTTINLSRYYWARPKVEQIHNYKTLQIM